MTVVLHFPSLFEAPAGVWWHSGVSLEHHYADESLRLAGEHRMRLMRDATEEQAEALFTQLAESSGHTEVWATATVTGEMDPQSYLSVVRQMAARELRTRAAK